MPRLQGRMCTGQSYSHLRTRQGTARPQVLFYIVIFRSSWQTMIPHIQTSLVLILALNVHHIRSTTPKRPAGQRPEPFRNPNQTGFALGTGQVTFSGTMLPPFMFTPFGMQYGATYSGTIGGNGAGNFFFFVQQGSQLTVKYTTGVLTMLPHFCLLCP